MGAGLEDLVCQFEICQSVSWCRCGGTSSSLSYLKLRWKGVDVGCGWDGRLMVVTICPVDIAVGIKGTAHRVCGTTHFSDRRTSETLLGETHVSTDPFEYTHHATTTATSKGQGFRGMAHCNAVHRNDRVHDHRS